MKDWIKTYLRESLEEISTKPKPEFGFGADHKVYHSRQHPDRLYKIGDEDMVDEWLSIFQEHPKYFPRVYRVFPYKKDPTMKVVEIEKLDTGKAKTELNTLTRFLISISDQVHCGNEIIGTTNFFKPECFNAVATAAYAMNNPQILPLLTKWAKFLRVVAPMVEKNLGRNLDLHIGNVAYDKEGNLKMIDI